MLEITPSKQNIEKRMEKKLWKQPKTSGTTLNAPTLTLLGEPEGEERKKRPEKIFEKFPNMGKEIVNQVQRVSGMIKLRRNTARHTVIKLTKIEDKDKILKATRGKWQITGLPP